MDGVVSAVPIDISQLKAYSAASFRTPTHLLAESNLDNPAAWPRCRMCRG